MPAKDRPPSFQFYPRDWMADPAVQGMTWDQRGRYLWALCCSRLTDRPGIASEDQWRRWMAYSEDEWPSHRPALSPAFRVMLDGLWKQARTVEDRREQARRHKRATAGAHARWRKAKGDMDGEASPQADAHMMRANGPASASASALEESSLGTLCLNAPAQPLTNGNGVHPGVSTACLGRMRGRFPTLDLPVIEAKMMAEHSVHPMKSLDRGFVNWCKKADENGWDQKPSNGPRITPDEWARRKEAGESF